MRDFLEWVPLRYLNNFSRLRDLSQETEQEQRRRISEMEKDITGIDDLQCKKLVLHVADISSYHFLHSTIRVYFNQVSKRGSSDR